MRKKEFQNLRYNPIDFLLSARQPAWVKYQTHVRILKKSQDDQSVSFWREKRDESAIVAKIRARQNSNGSFNCMPWAHVHEYYFHRLIEMGYDMEDYTVNKAANQLLYYQLPQGGYMHPIGPRVNNPDPTEGWSACVTGYVTKALLDLGLREHPAVEKALQVLYDGQNYDGGWICQRGGPCVDESNCIISGSPWSFACLVQANLIKLDDPLTKQAILMFTSFEKEIITHRYMIDRYYRCDESLLLPYLYSLGLSNKDKLFRKLYNSLKEKQHPDGSWYFRGKRSSWYTLESAYVLLEFGDN